MEVQPLATVPRSLEEIASAHQSASDRTPSTVLKSFLPGQAKIGDLVLPPMSIHTWMLLEDIKSPFIQATATTDVGMADVMATLYVLTHGDEETEALITKGDGSFKTAVKAMAKSLPIRHILTVSDVIGQHIASEFASKASLAPAKAAAEGGDSPLEPSAPATVAAAL